MKFTKFRLLVIISCLFFVGLTMIIDDNETRWNEYNKKYNKIAGIGEYSFFLLCIIFLPFILSVWDEKDKLGDINENKVC